MTKTIAKGRMAFGGFAIAAGGMAAYFGGPLIHNNEAATGVIVTVFSILAGFLIAVMSIMGDPSSLLPGGWRLARGQSDMIRSRLRRQQYLFYVYLAALGMVFLAMLLKDIYPKEVCYLERAYLGLSVTGFIFSLRLPAALMALQHERVEFVVNQRKKKAGISDL